MIIDEAREIGHHATIERIIDFVKASNYLQLSKDHLVRPRKVYVDVVNNANSSAVIADLAELVKLSDVGDSYFSKITVKKRGSSIAKLIVSYNKKVLFLKSSGERITKDVATYLIGTWNI